MKKVLIFVVCYNAEQFISGVLSRIPEEVWTNAKYKVEVLVIDDESTDMTFHTATEYAHNHPEKNITVLGNPENQGYGGNQKIGYHYAVKNGFDIVVLLHGDGQYAPEYIQQMIDPILKDEADVVFGSRMINKMDALKGKMPFYKWIGNQTLTKTQNRILKTSLSEFHTGYRAYSCRALASIPFMHNSDYFDFDTDIIIQLVDNKMRIREIPIPTYYGDEVSRVNGFRYAFLIIRSTLLSRVMNYGIFYHPKFDYDTGADIYKSKFGFPSSHQYALDKVSPGSSVFNIGCGPGHVTKELVTKKQASVISVDNFISEEETRYSGRAIQADLDDFNLDSIPENADVILMLDVIEHLKKPEAFLEKLRSRYGKESPSIIITTGNIAFATMRASLLFGKFNYGKRGILDMDHKRLFTFSSLRSILVDNGFDIVEENGIPAPFPLAFGEGALSGFLLALNSVLILLSKSIFSYQIAMIAKPRPTLEHLLDRALKTQIKKDNSVLSSTNGN